MQVPLDSSIYFLSFNDLKAVINLGNYIDIKTISFVFAGIISYFGIAHLLKNKTIKPSILTVLLVAASVSSPFSIYYSKISSKTMSMNNHLNYFVHQSIDHFRSLNQLANQKEITTADFSELDQRFFPSKTISNPDFPLMHELENDPDFVKQFNLDEKKPPNIVFILIESLNSYFVDEKSDHFINVMPFLTSLSNKSLFFPNTLSTGERTLNVLPSTLASLPIASENASPMDLDPFPLHFSLPSILNQHYFSRFYCGVNLNYSNMNGYMNYNKVSYLVKNWEPQFKKMNGEYYHDGDVFRKSWLDLEKTKNIKNRLDIFLTFNTHEPFLYPNRKEYGKKVEIAITNSKLVNSVKTHILKNKDKFGAYSYLDDQLKEFFKEAEKRPEHKNTIYFIVGDHGSEICLFEPTSRFHTSLIVYSPMLKKPKISKATVSHLDLPPSILQLLKRYDHLNIPNSVPFIGKTLVISDQFSCDNFYPFKANNLSLSGLIFGNYFMDYGALYKLNDQLKATPVDNLNQVDQFNKQLGLYQKLSTYCLNQNHIINIETAQQYITIDKLYPFFYMSDAFSKDKFTLDEFIGFGDVPVIPLTNKLLEINIEIELEGKELTSEKDLPPFIYDFYEKTQKGNQTIHYKGIAPKLRKKFNKNGTNTLIYSTRIQLSDFKRNDKTIFDFYLLNTSKKYFNIKSYVINMKSDKASKKMPAKQFSPNPADS